MTGHLLVMAKRPTPGRVKTRLCPPCTPRQAADLAAAALGDTLDAIRRTRAERRVLAIDEPVGVAAPGFDVIAQRGTGLAERIANAFADVTACSPGPILLVGMDTPQIVPGLLAESMSRLRQADAVLGPACDGGWWALGLRDGRNADLLRTVPMSTPATGRLTARALSGAGLGVSLLPVLRDVDTFDDALAVAEIVSGGKFAAAVADVFPTAPATGRVNAQILGVR